MGSNFSNPKTPRRRPCSGRGDEHDLRDFRAVPKIATIRAGSELIRGIPDKPNREEYIMRKIVSNTCLAALALVASAGIAAADEVKLISVGGVKLGLDPIIAEFTKQTGHQVTYFAGSPAMVSQKL